MRRIIRCKYPTGAMLAAYLSRGLEPPLSVGYSYRPWSLGRAMLRDTADRAFHARYAMRHGFFWIPCPRCGKYFGGHEISTTVPDPERGSNAGKGVCTYCTVRLSPNTRQENDRG